MPKLKEQVSASAPMIPESQSATLDKSNTVTNSSGVQVTWTVPLATLPSGDWPMIWSWNNAGPAGSDSGARLQMHSRFGRMAIPMQVVTSPSPSSASSTPSMSAAALAMGYDVAKHNRVVWAHAAMMVGLKKRSTHHRFLHGASSVRPLFSSPDSDVASGRE